MERRLVKIAKELNVGLSTIVDFLQDKGHDIDPKPTAKVSEEMYQELLQEFQRSMSIKEQADQLVIGTRPSSGGGKKDEAAVKEERPSVLGKAAEVPGSSILKTRLAAPPAPKSAPPADPEPEPEPVVEEAPAEPVAEEVPEDKPANTGPKLKVLGKIDLDAAGKGAKKEVPKKEEPQEEPVQEAPPVEEVPAEAEETPKPVAEEAPAEVTPEPEPEVKETPTEPVASEEPTTAEAGGEAGKEAKAKAEAPKAAADGAPAGGEEAPKQPGGITRAKTPELRGLKILGKIDTSKLGSGRGKSKKEKEKDKGKTGKPAVAGASKTGDAKKQSAGAGGERKRRPRTRKKITARDARGGGNQRGGNRRTRRDEVKEVSQKEIEDKIKATMARMAGGGKKKRQKLRRDNRERLREKQELREMESQTDKLQVTEFISVQELANMMDVAATDVIMTCMNVGVIVSINQRLDAEIIELVAEEFNHEVEFISVEEVDEDEEDEVDDPADLEPRAPVVTIMGHVDHGKTSLLDYIREATVAEGEAGGITQHIGAYEVRVGDDNKRITFLDTPGHEAFTAMRARGAKVTDIAVIIIAADDNIMPQTREAISHAEAAGVPMVFAINKIDKPGANPERIKQELASMNYLIEEWGGGYGSADISAKQGTNIDTLLERILLEAEVKELQANPDRGALGTVLEASLDKGRGYVAKMLVQTGTLKIGDSMVSGEHSGRVKAMFNERNKRVKEAGPSTPVLVLGLGGAPQAGERFKVVESEQEARDIANRRGQIAREQANRATKRISLDEIGRRLALGNFKELNLIVKGDVDGSVEALSDSLIKLSQETVQVNVIHRAVGQIIESDVLLATASDAIVIGFQVRPSSGARKLAEREGVQIKTYSVIYEAIEEIKLAIEGMLDTIKEENVLGQLEVREIFKISKVGTVAGCFVSEGKILRENNVRLIREGIVVYPTKEGVVAEIKALKRFKDDVKEVRGGMECGVSIKNYNDIKVGDVIEAYEIVEVKQKLSL
ncbi:MAG: translation initiation factor IF-2 [Bacteroidota bacterium]